MQFNQKAYKSMRDDPQRTPKFAKVRLLAFFTSFFFLPHKKGDAGRARARNVALNTQAIAKRLRESEPGTLTVLDLGTGPKKRDESSPARLSVFFLFLFSSETRARCALFPFICFSRRP